MFQNCKPKIQLTSLKSMVIIVVEDGVEVNIGMVVMVEM